MAQEKFRWQGGRFYFDDQGRQVFFIERRVAGRQRTIRLKTHDEKLALGLLATFEADPVAFVREPGESAPVEAVYITDERIALYLASIRNAVQDHRNARENYLTDWSAKKMDLRTVDRRTLRVKLAEFTGGHNGRTEALNAFARFLVKEGDLEKWAPLVCEHDAESTRAERMAYSMEQLRGCYARITNQRVRDVIHIRVATGMHHTEIAQIAGCKLYSGPLPDRGAGLRDLGDAHDIRGVLQVKHKTKPRHRVSLSAGPMEAATRLRDTGVPDRELVWEKMAPLVPSNLRHTWVTLCGEIGELVTFKGAGVPLDIIQQIAGHRIGSKVTQSSYDKLQVPPMVRLPLSF